MTIEEIVGEVEKAFPGHRGVLLPPKHAAGEYIIEGVALKGVDPRRVTLRVLCQIYDDRSDNERRFDDKVSEAIARMKVEGAAELYTDSEGILGERSSSHRVPIGSP